MLGFDPCNTAVWDNEEVTNNPDNQYVQYFVNNPQDLTCTAAAEAELQISARRRCCGFSVSERMKCARIKNTQDVKFSARRTAAQTGR